MLAWRRDCLRFAKLTNTKLKPKIYRLVPNDAGNAGDAVSLPANQPAIPFLLKVRGQVPESLQNGKCWEDSRLTNVTLCVSQNIPTPAYFFSWFIVRFLFKCEANSLSLSLFLSGSFFFTQAPKETHTHTQTHRHTHPAPGARPPAAQREKPGVCTDGTVGLPQSRSRRLREKCVADPPVLAGLGVCLGGQPHKYPPTQHSFFGVDAEKLVECPSRLSWASTFCP